MRRESRSLALRILYRELERPQSEIDALMQLLCEYAESEHEELASHGVQVRVLGETSRLDSPTRAAVELIEDATRDGAVLRLNLMISYGGREEIARAARRLAERACRGRLEPETIDVDMIERMLFTRGLPDPDLLFAPRGR